MPRGGPDYGAPQYQVANANVDVSALVLAQKGVNSVDGKGRLWLIDTFGEGLTAWNPDSGGDGSNPYPTCAYAEVAPISIAMPCGTLTGGGSAEIVRTFYPVANVRPGFEVGVAVDPGGPDYLIVFQYGKSGVGNYGAVRLSVVNKKISIITPSGTVDVVTLPANFPEGGWYPVKLVIDFDDAHYVRLCHGQEVIDLSTYPLEVASVANSGALLISIDAIPVNNGGQGGLLGHVIITLDEP